MERWADGATRWFANSLIVTLGSTLISIAVSTLAAYSLTRFRYWGRSFVPYFSILGYMVPSIIFVFPLFLVMVRLDLTDTLLSLILGYVSITLPFCMWLMWAFMRSIPIEIEEAALIDGASRIQVFAHVVLPGALPLARLEAEMVKAEAEAKKPAEKTAKK